MLDENKIKYYQEKINEMGDWYQPIEFIKGKLRSKSRYNYSSTTQGINKWNFIIRRNLPKNLKGLKILDLGCASGLFSISCARRGAKVVGVELDNEGYRQSLLTREIYSQIDETDYSENFEVIKCDFMNFDWEKYGKFDVVLALNVLYWIETPYEKISSEDRKNYSNENLIDLMKKIRCNAKTIIIQADENKYRRRLKDKGSLEATDSRMVAKLLKKCGFRNIKIDKPVALKSLWRTLIFKSPEVDLKKPIFYSRPIIKAES